MQYSYFCQMIVEQIYTGCLSEAAYYIESNGIAAIVDPLRETTPYLTKLNEQKAELKYIFITHFHADFVSGHVDLAKETGATIVFGPNAEAEFAFHNGEDNEIFNLGDIEIKLMHTPGHTLESSCYLLSDENKKDYCVFTGDTLFIGDVGRPDLAVKSHLNQDDLAKLLHQSLKSKIIPLSDDVIIYPAHGAGSSCGKNMSKETFDTLGHQKKVNYALNQNLSESDFVKEATCGLNQPPQYFPENVKMNKRINTTFDEIISNGLNPISPENFKAIINNDKPLVIDCRKPNEFAESHIPNSLFIGIDGGFAPWAGTVINDLTQKILLVGNESRIQEAITRLSRVGIDNTIGFLKGGISAWENHNYETSSIRSIDAASFENEDLQNANIIDVRNNNEYENGHLKQSTFLPLDNISTNISNYKEESSYYIHCQGGYRSMIACSILKSKGIHNLTDIKGGFVAIESNTNLRIEKVQIIA